MKKINWIDNQSISQEKLDIIQKIYMQESLAMRELLLDVVYEFTLNKAEVKNLLEWCSELPNTSKGFDNLIYDLYANGSKMHILDSPDKIINYQLNSSYNENIYLTGPEAKAICDILRIKGFELAFKENENLYIHNIEANIYLATNFKEILQKCHEIYATETFNVYIWKFIYDEKIDGYGTIQFYSETKKKL